VTYFVLYFSAGREFRRITLYLGMMDEEIITRGSYQEAITFLCVEPLDAPPLAR
jgi:hypothetical protein